MYRRTTAHDDENKRQQTRKNQERRTVFTDEYNKRRGPNFGSQNTQNFNQQPRFGNRNYQTPYRLTGFNIDRNRNPNSDRQYHQERSSNSRTNGSINHQQTQYNFKRYQRTQILNTTKTFHRTTIYLHPTQFNLLTIKDKM